MENAHSDLFARIVAALVTPRAGQGEGVLVGFQPPVAVVEVSSERAGLVLVDGAGASVAETTARVARLVAANEGQWMVVAVVGGPDEMEAALREVDRGARDPRGLSLYVVDGRGKAKKLSGGLSRVLELAARAAPETPPLALDAVPELIARSQRERADAQNFWAQLRGRRPYATVALVAICVLVCGLIWLWHGAADWGAMYGPAVRAGEVWRLFSAVFVHQRPEHLLMNMIGLWSLGSFLERVFGWRRFLVLFALSGLAGSCATGWLSEAPSVGASGALWGLMLGGFALMRARRSVIPARLAQQMRQRLMGVLVLNIALSFIPGIDKFAHFGGGIAGFLLVASGFLTPRSIGAVGDEPLAVRLLAPLLAFLMAAALVAALVIGRPWAG